MWGEGEGKREEPKRVREKQAGSRIRERGGARSPFYSGPGLSGCCQVTMGKSIPGCSQVTVGMESRQYPELGAFALHDRWPQNYGAGASHQKPSFRKHGKLPSVLCRVVWCLGFKPSSSRKQAASLRPTLIPIPCLSTRMSLPPSCHSILFGPMDPFNMHLGSRIPHLWCCPSSKNWTRCAASQLQVMKLNETGQ